MIITKTIPRIADSHTSKPFCKIILCIQTLNNNIHKNRHKKRLTEGGSQISLIIPIIIQKILS